MFLMAPQAELFRKPVCHCLFRCPFFLFHHINLLPPSVIGLIFYDTKVTVMNRVLNATVQRTADHAAPEITLDPLEIVGGMFLFVPPVCPPVSSPDMKTHLRHIDAHLFTRVLFCTSCDL